MSVNVELYKNLSDNRYVTKNIELMDTVLAVWYENTSIVTPTIRFTFPSELYDVNYAKIPAFGRYYYITDARTLQGHGVEMDLRCDVLMTYKGTILNSTQFISRNEGIGKPSFIADSNYPLRINKDMAVIKFEGGNFNLNEATTSGLNFVLNVSGGA
jgi:hypothetical protein